MATVLGIDVGEKKIGLAIGRSTDGWVFTRLALLVSTWSEAWSPLQQLVNSENVDTIVIGLPLETDGSIGVQATRIKDFATELKDYVSVPVLERDERHTTLAVHKEHVGQKMARGEEDSLAAQLLVEAYLEELRHA